MRLTGLRIECDDGELAWRTTRHAGVRWLPLTEASAASTQLATPPGPASVLIRMDPGCGYPRHRHLGLEEVLILQGGYRDESGEHRAPCYLRNEAGSVHAPVALGDRGRPIGPQNPACLLFAVAHGGVANLGEDEA